MKQYILALQTGVVSSSSNYLSVNVPFEVNKIIFINIEAGNASDGILYLPTIKTSLIGIDNEIPCNYSPIFGIPSKSNKYEFYFNARTPINGNYNFTLNDSLSGLPLSFHSLSMVLEFIQT